MKLILAIIQDEDAHEVITALNDAKFQVTRLNTKGGFLRAGNTTLLIGVEEEQVDDVIALIGKKAHSHKQVVTSAAKGEGSVASMPLEVKVGGATVFVVDVDKFVKL